MGRPCDGGEIMIVWKDFSEGRHRITCPSCGRGARDKTLGLTIEQNNGVAHCFRCGYVEVHKDALATTKQASTVMKSVAKHVHERLSDYGHALWAQCQPLSGVAVDYLHYRGCVIPPADGDLKFHPNLKHPSGHCGPALVALVTDAVTGHPKTLHRTWITPTGKADLDPARLLLKDCPKQGGVIRLWPDDYVTHGLAIAEGIETALSLAHGYTPVWSVIDAGNMGAFAALPGIEFLVIGADNDPAGIQGAATCAARWRAAGKQVAVITPSAQGADFNQLPEAAHEQTASH